MVHRCELESDCIDGILNAVKWRILICRSCASHRQLPHELRDWDIWSIVRRMINLATESFIKTSEQEWVTPWRKKPKIRNIHRSLVSRTLDARGEKHLCGHMTWHHWKEKQFYLVTQQNYHLSFRTNREKCSLTSAYILYIASIYQDTA